MKTFVPRALYRGDTIAISRPSERAGSRANRARGRPTGGMGFRVKFFGDIYRRWGYLAGDDETRAEELMHAVADPEVAAIFPARGGTGVTRFWTCWTTACFASIPKFLPALATSPHCMPQCIQQAGWVTFHRPHPMDGLGVPDGLTDLSGRTFWRAVLAENYDESPDVGYEVPLNDSERGRSSTFTPGKVRRERSSEETFRSSVRCWERRMSSI